MSHSRTLALFVMIMLGLASKVPAQGNLDREVQAAYAGIESARQQMVAESEKIDEEEMGRRMKAYGETVKAFIDRYAPRASELKTARYELGRAYVQVFDFESAYTHLKTFVQTYPRHAEVQQATLYLGDACRATGRTDEAIRLYEALMQSGPDAKLLADVRLQLATSYTLALRFRDAIKAYDAVIKGHAGTEQAADAAVQLVNVLFYDGQFDRARKHIAAMQSESSDAPELTHLADIAGFLGTQAPDLESIKTWVGEPGTNVARQRGRVLVLCFFTPKSVPCAHMLQTLSRIKGELRLAGVTMWGVSRAYYTAKGHMPLEGEKRLMRDYRANPAQVLQKLLRLKPEDLPQVGDLKKSIDLPVALTLTDGFKNLRAYKARRVPHVVVIDTKGRVRLIEEAGQPDGGFQSQMLEKLIRTLAVE